MGSIGDQLDYVVGDAAVGTTLWVQCPGDRTRRRIRLPGPTDQSDLATMRVSAERRDQERPLLLGVEDVLTAAREKRSENQSEQRPAAGETEAPRFDDAGERPSEAADRGEDPQSRHRQEAEPDRSSPRGPPDHPGAEQQGYGERRGAGDSDKVKQFGAGVGLWAGGRWIG